MVIDARGHVGRHCHRSCRCCVAASGAHLFHGELEPQQ